MRVLASNPDTIGDMVLRQPLYRALADAGHELTLIVRASVAPVVPLVAPTARVLVLPGEVYGGGPDGRWADFAPVVAAAREARPDLLLVAPYQWTRFEERLAADLRRDVPGVVVAGMSGHLYPGDPFAGPGPASDLTLDRVTPVDADLPEAEKNAALAAMLGCPVAAADPAIGPDEASLAAARGVLADRGLRPGDYHLACVTGTANVPIKAWPAERWAAVLRAWHERHGRRFLFVGLPDERAFVEQVQAGMGEAAGTAAGVWMEPGGAIGTLAALASLSGGYVGHDTGPMHVAAACGRPTLAVFGGGHKLRFAPRVTPSVSLSVRVPCAGCGWACSFDKAHCVRALTVEQVLAAVDDLEAGRVAGREARLHPASPELLGHMTRFAADLARRRSRDAAGLARDLKHVVDEKVPRLTTERDVLAGRAANLELDLASARGHVGELDAGMRRLADESADLVRQVQDREQTIAELRAATAAADARTAAEAEGRRGDVEALRAEAAMLRGQVDVLRAQAEAARMRMEELRLQLAQPKLVEPAAAVPQVPAAAAVPVRVRRSWRERLVDLACGQRHYVPKHVPRPMPKILVVTRVVAADADEDVRRTVDSVMGERYSHLEYVLAADDVDRPVVREYAEQVTRVVAAGPRPFGAAAEAFAVTDADVVAWLDVGTEYEPGALMRAGEFFRDRPAAMAATFGVTSEEFGQALSPWRFPWVAPWLSTESLRAHPTSADVDHVLFRRPAYVRLGPLDPSKGEAAGWDLKIRFARRFGIRRGPGHGTCERRPPTREEPADDNFADDDFAGAAGAFEAAYGPAGQARGVVVDAAGRWLDAARRRWGRDRRWRWFWLPWQAPTGGYAAAPAVGGATPVSPVTHRRPDRLLFSAPDAMTGDRTIYRAYYDTAGDVAVAFPPTSGAELERLHAERARVAGSAALPVGAMPLVFNRQAVSFPVSPYQGYRGGPAWVRRLGEVPSPYWKLTGRRAGDDPVADRLVSLVRPGVRADDADVRALVVGCFDGSLLDDLKRLTKWQLAGIETNPAAFEQTKAKGHEVWPCSPQDAFMTLPDGRVFDLILVPAMLEHWVDPPWVLRRLVRLLTPAGRLVVRTPNLDSRLLDLFGPTWWHWQLPYHRTLLGRRGLRNLAAMCDLRMERLRTVTDAYAAAASVQLNAVGLAGVVPEGAAFPPAVAARGAKLAGWARLLWDRWGRGDEMWAVLRPV